MFLSNALSQRNALDWNPPFDPSFTDEEIAAVREWVNQGGALMMMVDHFPMPATAGKLAEAFGVRIHNGLRSTRKPRPGRSFTSAPTNRWLITRSRRAARRKSESIRWRRSPARRFKLIAAIRS